MTEVVINVANYADLVAISIDGTAPSQAFSIAKDNIVCLAGTEEVDTLQEVDAEEERDEGYDAYKSYLYFCFHLISCMQ